jgi:hypothetical protein
LKNLLEEVKAENIIIKEKTDNEIKEVMKTNIYTFHSTSTQEIHISSENRPTYFLRNQ